MFPLIFCSLCTQTFARMTSIYVTICIPLYYSHNVCARDFKNLCECTNAHSLEGTLVAALYRCRRRVFFINKANKTSQYVTQYNERLALLHLIFLACTNNRRFSKKRNRQNNVKLNLQSEIKFHFFCFFLLITMMTNV